MKNTLVTLAGRTAEPHLPEGYGLLWLKRGVNLARPKQNTLYNGLGQSSLNRNAPSRKATCFQEAVLL
jgi:hypothetical protein